MKTWLHIFFGITLILGASACATTDGDIARPGYRGWPYKAPTPMSAPGATTLYFAEDVKALIEQSDILLVNVSPLTLSPVDRQGKRNWIPARGKTRFQIPGSIWLPNVGYESLDPAMDDYFRKNLAHYSQGDRSRLLLFYCTADCWMSWNSVKRSLQEYGYQNVYWYPYGIDGWKEQELELETATPEPYSSHSSLPDA